MKLLTILFPTALFLLSACTTVNARIYDLNTGRVGTMEALAKDMSDRDVVFLGEAHGNPYGHQLQLEAIQRLHRLKSDMAISMEMVERDQQEALDLYLTRRMDEKDFIAALKTDKRGATFFKHYKPIFEYAFVYQIPVIAANMPRPLASRIGREGLDAVAKEKFMPQETSAPKDAYWDAFKEAFAEEGHGSDFTEEQLYRYYQAQCAKDDAMAESIVDYLKAQQSKGRSPLVVHLCGAFHSDHGRGTVMRVKQRLPSAQIGVISTKEEKRVRRPKSELGLADFLWVVREIPRKRPKSAKMPTGKEKADKEKSAKAKTDKVAGEPTSRPTSTPTSQPTSKPASQPTSKPTGEDDEAPDPDARPGLNFMPAYMDDQEEPGVEIESVSPDGAAEKAGLRDGDLLLKIDDHLLKDLSTYMKVLGGYRPGDKVTLTVVRDDKSIKIKATIGTSRRGR
jgi:uncharacterized iron-regulated protein